MTWQENLKQMGHPNSNWGHHLSGCTYNDVWNFLQKIEELGQNIIDRIDTRVIIRINSNEIIIILPGPKYEGWRDNSEYHCPAREKILLHILTDRTVRPHIVKYDQKDQLTLEWSY